MASLVSCADAQRTGIEHGKATENSKAPAEILESKHHKRQNKSSTEEKQPQYCKKKFLNATFR